MYIFFVFIIFAPKRKLILNEPISIKKQWEHIVQMLSEKFGGGEILEMEAIIYLIGVRELGKGNMNFKKDDKINLMHIAICRVLEPYGYYKFDFTDEQGWPHYKALEPLPYLKPGEQSILMKRAIIEYFKT